MSTPIDVEKRAVNSAALVEIENAAGEARVTASDWANQLLACRGVPHPNASMVSRVQHELPPMMVATLSNLAVWVKALAHMVREMDHQPTLGLRKTAEEVRLCRADVNVIQDTIAISLVDQLTALSDALDRMSVAVTGLVEQQVKDREELERTNERYFEQVNEIRELRLRVSHLEER
jgi:hypothetical protein